MRKVTYSKRAVKLPNATTLGYAQYLAHPGDFIAYKETYQDGSYSLRNARVIGRIEATDDQGPACKGFLLVCALSDSMTFGYERWIDPADVTECQPGDRASHFLAWFAGASPETLHKYTRDDLETRRAADLSHAP